MYTVRLIMVFLLEGRRQKTPRVFRSLLVIFVTQDLRAPPSPLPLPSLPALPWHVECCLRARPHALARPLASRQGQGGAAAEGGERRRRRRRRGGRGTEGGTRPTGAQAKVRAFSVARGDGGLWGGLGGYRGVGVENENKGFINENKENKWGDEGMRKI